MTLPNEVFCVIFRYPINDDDLPFAWRLVSQRFDGLLVPLFFEHFEPRSNTATGAISLVTTLATTSLGPSTVRQSVENYIRSHTTRETPGDWIPRPICCFPPFAEWVKYAHVSSLSISSPLMYVAFVDFLGFTAAASSCSHYTSSSNSSPGIDICTTV